MSWETVDLIVELAIILAAVAAVWIALHRGLRWWVRIALIGGGIGIFWAVDSRLVSKFIDSLWVDSYYLDGFDCVLALVMLTLAFTGLLFTWVALGRCYWFWRAAVALAVVSLLFLIPAYEILIIVMAQAFLVVPFLAIVHIRRERREHQHKYQFSLRDMLLFTFLCAVILGMLKAVPTEVWVSWKANIWLDSDRITPLQIAPWAYYLILGVVAGVFTIGAVWITLGRHSMLKQVIVLFVLYPALLLMALWWMEKSTPVWSDFGIAPVAVVSYAPFGKNCNGIALDESMLLAVSLVAVPVVLWRTLFQWLRLVQAAREDNHQKGTNRITLSIAYVALVAFSVVWFIPLGLGYWVLKLPSIPEVVMPEPNSFTQLSAMAKPLEKFHVPYCYRKNERPSRFKINPQDYIDFAKKHEKTLAEARKVLSQPGRVPVDYTQPDHWPSFYPHQCVIFTPIDRLGCAFIASGRAACYEGHYEQGIEWYIDSIRLSRRSYEGGLWAHWNAGNNIEEDSVLAIHDTRKHMPLDVRKKLIKELLKLGEEGENYESLIQRDAIWWQHVLDWSRRFYMSKPGHYDFDSKIEDQQNLWNQSLALFRLAIIELALENYRDAQGKYPEKLDELVPGYLDRLPVDPFSDKSFCYRMTDKGCRVYSVGEDGEDNGGYDENEPAGNGIVEDLWLLD